jgi:hypothetical protein
MIGQGRTIPVPPLCYVVKVDEQALVFAGVVSHLSLDICGRE